ncbi:hypothetical protein NC652_016328 [Populus alba x Populus x berolinensis]|nr:hypothetical protein NC652_016328 [Populus alba x Populus x berolinensis]
MNYLLKLKQENIEHEKTNPMIFIVKKKSGGMEMAIYTNSIQKNRLNNNNNIQDNIEGELIFEILGAYSFENFGVILDLGAGWRSIEDLLTAFKD